MNMFGLIGALTFGFGIGNAVFEINEQNCNVDSASLTLSKYKEEHSTPNLLTTSAGKPVGTNDTETLNSDLLLNLFFLESIKHAVHQKIPPRAAFLKGVAARGYFEVTNNITQYTLANLFKRVGKKTPIFARFSTSLVQKGSSTLGAQSGRGMAVKYYTEEGNLDLFGIQIPIFFFQNPIYFNSFVHASGVNPQTNIPDATAVLEFLLEHPVSLQAFLWNLSEKGLPRGFRYMNGYGIHTFKFYNEFGQNFLVKYRYETELGFQSFSPGEVNAVNSFDYDFFHRDFFNAIQSKKYPSWKLVMDVIPEYHLENLNFDPFDITRHWPSGTYETVEIGRIVLNKNVDNNYAETEQVAFLPNNLVPGISEALDPLYKTRIFAYNEDQIHRLGINRYHIPVNCPQYSATYNRDGSPPVFDNMKNAPNYFPNSFNGPKPYVEMVKTEHHFTYHANNNPDYEGCTHFYNNVLIEDSQKKRLVNSIVQLFIRVAPVFTDRLEKLLEKVDLDLAKRFKDTFNFARKNVVLPNLVDDINDQTVEPYSSLN